MKKANIYQNLFKVIFTAIQEKDEATIQNILTEDQNLQMLQEIGFRGNPYKITQSMKSTALR